MKKTIIILTAILLTLFFGTLANASSLQKSIIPAEAKWVIHFDMEKFASSQIYNFLMENEITAEIREKNAELSKKFNINFFEDIAAVTVYGIKKEKQTTVCISGNFDKDHLLTILKAETEYKEIPYGKYTIYNWDKHEYGVFVDSHLFLISGNEETIQNALDVISGKKANVSSSPVMSDLKEIPKEAFLMAYASDISSLANNGKGPFVLNKTGMGHLTIAEKGNNLALNINSALESEEDAKNIEQVIRGGIAMVQLQNDEKMMKLKELLNRIQLSFKGNKIQIGLTYPVKDLVEFLTKDGKHFLGIKEFHPKT